MRFKNRKEAGTQLAARLDSMKLQNPLVLGLPRGGVPIAAAVATGLSAELDVLFVKKISLPEQPELALGAVTEHDVTWINEELLDRLGVSMNELDRIRHQRLLEIQQKVKKLRRTFPAKSLKDRSVILVDDGIATGATILAAIEHLKRLGVRSITVAAPVCAKSVATHLKSLVDRVVTLASEGHFFAIGEFYDDFSQVSDAEVDAILLNQQKLNDAFAEKFTVEDQGIKLDCCLLSPAGARACVVFVHGSGSNSQSPRNLQIAQGLREAGFATMLFDLETSVESQGGEVALDLRVFSRRLQLATKELRKRLGTSMQIAYFGSSSGAAVALHAAAHLPREVYALVCRGGRPDLVLDDLPKVRAPTLLLVGSRDPDVLEFNLLAQRKIPVSELRIIPGASHLFEEFGALQRVTDHAIRWLRSHLRNAHQNLFKGI